MKYGTLLLGFDYPFRFRLLGEPHGVMACVSVFACRLSWAKVGRFGNGSRWFSGWHVQSDI